MLPLDPVIATWVDLLAQSIQAQCLEGRGIMAYAVKVAPLLNKEARDLWRAEARAPYLLTYSNYVLDCGHRLRYLDALPADVLAQPLYKSWGGYKITPRKAIEVQDMHQARTNRALRIEKEGVDPDVHNCLRATKKPDYPIPNLPVGVRSLVEHVESHHRAFAMHASYKRYFCTCQRVGCTRPALLQAPETTEGESSEAEYWACCRDGRTPAPDAQLPSDMAFCSHGCFIAANNEFQRVVKFEIVTPLCETRRSGGGQKPEIEGLYRAALRRNSGLERTLLRSPIQKTKHYPSKQSDHERLRRDRITMLSVDVGLLYAAYWLHYLPRSHPSRPNRQLPHTESWRARAQCYLKAVERVREIYLQHGGGRITKTGDERWLRIVKDRALWIFK